MFVCKYAHWVPMLKIICPSSSDGPVSNGQLPPMNALATQTAHLINVLVGEEVPAPARLVAMQTLVLDIQGRVEASNIDSHVKSQLNAHLPELDLLLDEAADDMITMRTTFIEAIDNLAIYTENIVEGVSRITDGRQPFFAVKRVEAPPTAEQSLQMLYDEYQELINTEVSRLLKDALKTQETLFKTRDKVKVIEDIYRNGAKIAQDTLDDIQLGTFWRQLFGGNKIDIERQKRALNTLNDFLAYNHLFSEVIGHVILEIKEYRTNVKRLKSVKRLPGPLAKTMDMYLKQMRAALSNLARAKDTFLAKINRGKEPPMIE